MLWSLHSNPQAKPTPQARTIKPINRVKTKQRETHREIRGSAYFHGEGGKPLL